MKCRVHIECRSAKMVECIAYVVQTGSAAEAKEKGPAHGPAVLLGV